MTYDEKLAVIAGNLRKSLYFANKAEKLRDGAIFELAMIAVGQFADNEEALDLAKMILPSGDRVMLARFCELYHKYKRNENPMPFPQPELSEHPKTVMIPEITKLDEAILYLKKNGVQLDREYGDSFSACAEDVEFGRSRYVLMPMYDPLEGRLRSFDRLRDKYGLKIHRVIKVPYESGGEYLYQLCGLGFPDISESPVTRLSFTADTHSDIYSYLGGVKVMGADILSAELESNADLSRVHTVLNIEDMDSNALCGLLMYLSADADLIIDGCYAEI